MLITMLGQMSGTRDGLPWPPPGHTIDLPDAEATQLIGNQMAVPAVDLDTGVEIAVRDVAPVENRETANRDALVKRSRPAKTASAAS